MGLWLGDGTSRKPQITNQDPEIRDFIHSYAEKVGLSVTTYNGTFGNKCPQLYITARNESNATSNPVLQGLQALELINNKHIPQSYLLTSAENRLLLLAGLLDSDGHRIPKGNNFSIVQKNQLLAEQIVILSRSLGFSATINQTKNWCTYKGTKREGVYYEVYICGNVDRIPVRVKHKIVPYLKSNVEHLVSGFEVEFIGEGDFYGFEIDGPDHLFLMSDFTVVHNTSVFEQLTKNILLDDPENIVVWFYSEESDMNRWESIGVTPEMQKRIYALGCFEGDENFLDTAEKQLDRIKTMVKDPRVKGVFIDSIKAMCAARMVVDENGKDKSLADGYRVAMRASLVTEFIRDFKIHNKRAILGMTNQEMDQLKLTPSDMYSNPKYTFQTPGGRTMEFECQLRIRSVTRPLETEKHELTGDSLVYGWQNSFRVIKNKFCKSSTGRVAVAEFLFDPPGFNHVAAVLMLGEYLTRKGFIEPEKGALKGGGGFWKLVGQQVRGEDAARALLAQNPDLVKSLEGQIYRYADKLFKFESKQEEKPAEDLEDIIKNG